MGFLDTIKDLFGGKKVDENQTEEVSDETKKQEDSYDGGEASEENKAE